MTLLTLDTADLATLVAVISHSQIVVDEAVECGSSLPAAGFDDVDTAILDVDRSRGSPRRPQSCVKRAPMERAFGFQGAGA